MGMYVKNNKQRNSLGDVVENLYQSIMNNKIASSHYINMQANMINSYTNIDRELRYELKAKEFLAFYQELNYMINQILVKEAILFKKIEAISNIQLTIYNDDQNNEHSDEKTMKTKLDEDYDLYKVILEDNKTTSHLLDSLISLNDKGIQFLVRKDRSNNGVNYLLLKIINNIFEHQQLAYKRIGFLYFHGHVLYDMNLQKVLISNVEKSTMLIKRLLTNHSFNNKTIITLLHKKVILFIRLKKEIDLFFKENIGEQNFSSPWISRTIKRNRP